jgi:hypothetical protein
MEELSIEQIKQLCNSPQGLSLKKKVSQYAQSEQGYSRFRKRPKNRTEERILAGFNRSK